MGLIEFEWLRSPDAYVIVPPRSHVRMWRPKGARERLVPNPDPTPSLSTAGERYFETYRPTEFPELFQRFVDMPATAEGMRDFYNKFGPLRFGLERIGSRSLEPGWFSHGTPVRDALLLHASLRRAIELFESGNLSGLPEAFKQEEEGWGQLRTELRPGTAGKLAMVLVPTSLIQFLWLQFAQYAGSDAKLLRCQQCNQPFLVGTGTGRRDTAKFCSNRCKVAAFQARRGAMLRALITRETNGSFEGWRKATSASRARVHGS
jgi:hypothetical protein